MRHEADAARPRRVAQETLPGAPIHEHGSRHLLELEVDEIGLHATEVAAHAGQLGQPFGERPRVGVVLCEAIDHLFEGDEPGRGEHAHLAHASAKSLAPPSRFFHVLFGSAEDAADRTRESFREAEGDGIGAVRDVRSIDAKGNSRIEDAGAIQMHAQPLLVRRVAGRAQGLERPHDAAVPVVGVLECDRGRDRLVRIVAGPDRLGDLQR